MALAASGSAHFRFGDFEVEFRAGELRRGDSRIKLGERPLQILAALLEHPGEVVTREELRQKLWPKDTFVDFEHGINTALMKLREALADAAENPRFIETLPRHGYRFIASVEIVGAQGGASATAPVNERRYSKRRWAVVAAGALLLVIGAVIGYHHFGKPPAPPMHVVPLTSFPGHEVDARFSPDGNQIAFSWDGEKEDNWDIYVKLIGEETPLRLTTDPGEDRSPAWSPDGRYIAFCRHNKDEDATYVVPALGGPERKLHSTNLGSPGHPSVDWSPDGRYLAYSDRISPSGGFGIFMLSLENPDEMRALTSLRDPDAYDTLIRLSPDGRRMAFTRHSGAHDIYVVPLGGGEARRLTHDNAWINGLDWTPDGANIVFSSNRLGGNRLWKVRVSGGEPEPLPVGQEDAFSPSLSHDGHRLAYTHSSRDVNIWRYEVPQLSSQTTTPLKLIASTYMDLSQQFSPDGKKIVFASERSGSTEIWVCDSDGSNPRQLTFFGGPLVGTPRWSPDGQQIAFDSNQGGNSDIYVVKADGGRPRRLTTGNYAEVAPSWSRDGRWIYFASDQTDAWQVWKIPPEGGRAVQVTKRGGFAALESTDGETLYYAKGPTLAGLWNVPVEGGEETEVLPQLAASLWGYWDLTTEGIYFYDVSTKAVESFSFATHNLTQIAKPEKGPVPFSSGFAVSADGRSILYAQVDREVADIMLAENFRW